MTQIYRIVCKRTLLTRKVTFKCTHATNKSSVTNVNRKLKKHALGRNFGAIFGAPGSNDSNEGSICSSNEPWHSNFDFYNNKKFNFGKYLGSSEYFSNYDTLALMG